MAKIDLEKLICSLAKRKYFSEEKLQDALKEQGLEYKDGEIVESQKPKFNFKVGQWIVAIGKCVYLIAKIDDFIVKLVEENGDKWVFSKDVLDDAHPWTVQDAKDGDVLYSLDSKQPFIFKHRKPNEQAEVYCGINIYGKFFVGNTKDCIITTDKYIPATNAQRALLFQKMKEAGYEWDADKKELKKIDNRFDYAHANIQQKDYSPEEDEELFFGDFRKTDSEDKGTASFANRQLYNRAILKILSDYIEKYPDVRFVEMLCNLGFYLDYMEESQITYLDLNKIINKQNHE